MSLDGFNASALLQELRPQLSDSRLQKFSQLTEFDFLLQLRAPGTTHKLLISLHPEESRFHLLTGPPPPAIVPNAFVMLCRKRVGGCRLQAMEQDTLDRRIVLRFHSGFGLAFDWAGRPSALVLIQWEEESTAPKVVSHFPSRGRFRKGCDYVSEALSLPTPLEFSAQSAWSHLLEAPPETPVEQGLGTRFSLWPPLWRKRFRSRCGARSLEELNINDFTTAWEEQLAPLQRANAFFRPGIAEDGELTYCASTPEFESMQLAAQKRWLGEGLAPGLVDFRDELVKTLGKNRDKALRKLKKREQDRRGAESAPLDQMKGDLLLAYATGLPRGSEIFHTEDWEGRPLSIALDPKLSATVNADRYYSRAKKKRRALDVLDVQIEKAREEIEMWDDLLYAARSSENQTDLEQVRKSMPSSQAQEKKRKTPEVPSSGPRRYRHGEFLILVGRNPAQNDKLSTKTAAKDDHWLHVRQGAGSHVLIRAAGLEPPPETVEAAAWLAAKFSSSSESGAVEVITTRARFLRKPKQGPLGKVLYRQETEMLVDPTSPPPEGLREENKNERPE